MDSFVPSRIISTNDSISIMSTTPDHRLNSTSPVDSSPPFAATPDSLLPSGSSSRLHLSSPVSSDSSSRVNGAEPETLTNSSQHLDVDPQILEALRSKDRIYVLKLGELMEGLINDRRSRIDLTPSTTYQRLLVHRCSAYYKLLPESDPITKCIIVLPTPESRVPHRRLCDLVPAESTTQPAFKIMRRSALDRRSQKSQSQTGSVAGEDADLSDIEPSEAGSLGGRSNATGGSNKKRMTIEEREAAYNEARSRIFMDFEEKEKEKEKDTSANSSSLSLISGSASTSGGGSSITGDLDEVSSSPATESENSGPSGPNSRDKDPRRVSRDVSSTSTRSLRSSAPFNNGPGSSRNSRAPSPSFTYATIYEPTQNPNYDPSQYPANSGYYPQHLYPYSPPGPPHPYFGPYPYYPPYNSYQPPPLQHSASDPPTPSSVDHFLPPQHGGYNQSYGWSHSQHQLQSPPQMQHPSQLAPQPHHNPNHVTAPPLHSPQYHQYISPPPPPPPHSYSYSMPAYYPPQSGQHTEPNTLHVTPNTYDVPRSMDINMVGNQANSTAPSVNRNGITSPPSNGRTSNRHSGFVGVNGGGKGRGAPPPMNQNRSAWSYGPGIGQGGYAPSFNPINIETIGPRLNSSRRQSGNNAINAANSRPSNCDDVSSTASSSTTSSSSRRTYTSTASSQHPLPPRPDWAVGLKPQPGLHPTQPRHHDHSHNNSRTMSPIPPSRNVNGNSSHLNTSSHQLPPQQISPAPLQSSADFPPLTSINATPEKRAPTVSGAWGNNPSTRSIRMPSPSYANSNAPAHRSNNTAASNSEARLEDSDRGFERPPPKSAELFNPKVLRRPTGGNNHTEKEKERPKGDTARNVTLAGLVNSMTLEGQDRESQQGAPNEPSSSMTAA